MTSRPDDELVPYVIGSCTIMLPRDHSLPAFQKKYRLYDKFVPILCEILNGKKYITDVGANIGDSVCAILQSCSNPIVCIEGHEPYFTLLERNLALMPGSDRVRRLLTLVGTGRFVGSLVEDGTTASLHQNGVQKDIMALDEVLAKFQIAKDAICLIKLDTDGYDADVIASSEATIQKSEPLLFWENYFVTMIR